MEIFWWFGAMFVAFLVGMSIEKYRQFKALAFEETTLKKIKRQMQMLVEELELTGSGIIVELEQSQNELKALIKEAERKISVMRLGQTGETAVDEVESRQDIIQRMFKEGNDAAAIARKTGSNQGEVQLILGLLNKQINK
jgi:hypothetical protein